MFLQLGMSSSHVFAINGVSAALCGSLSKRLMAPHGLTASIAFRSTQTLASLVDALLEEHGADERLLEALNNLMRVLTLRVSQSIDGADDEEIYQLGRVFAIVSELETKCRREPPGQRVVARTEIALSGDQ